MTRRPSSATTSLKAVFAIFLWLLSCADGFAESATGTQKFVTEQLADFSRSVCQSFAVPAETLASIFTDTVTTTSKPVMFRQTGIGTTVTVNRKDIKLLEIQLLEPPGRPRQTNITRYLPGVETAKKQSNHHSANASGSATSSDTNSDTNSAQEQNPQQATDKPHIRLSLNDKCNLTTAHQLVYDSSSDAPVYLTQLDANLKPVGDKQWINPALPSLTTTAANAIKVALIDSGINYLLPEIARGLATDSNGRLLGYDFWDMDNKPFDANPARSPFFIQRHGTRTASIVLTEAPGVKLVPYRYPRNDMTRMTDLVEHADALDIKVIGMPLGSNKYADWVNFASAAENHPQILFIVSAGNNGRDIDTNPVYPAAMEIKNMLVVTSADDFVHPAERTNFGRLSVDYMVPAEQLDATDFDGNKTKVSGSSYAVARLVALAARRLQQNPDQTAAELMASIKNQSVRAATSRFVAVGYLGDPLVSSDMSEIKLTVETIDFATATATATANNSGYIMPVQLIRLHDQWKDQSVREALASVNRLYRQCNITVEINSYISLQVPDYLEDLSTGNALTVTRAIGQLLPVTIETKAPSANPTRIFLARDTVMFDAYDANAFGIGNTRNRPWLTNSLWLTHGLMDTDIAMAHELFHIASNSGDHPDLDNNLMRDTTHPDNTILTDEQCDTAIKQGLSNGLLGKAG